MAIQPWAEVRRGGNPTATAPERHCAPWWGVPKPFRHKGDSRRFYAIGEVARALGRSSETLRRWERVGWLPRPPRTGPVNDVRGQRRAYPAEFAEAVVEIAEDEDIVGRKVADFSRSRFFERVKALPHDW